MQGEVTEEVLRKEEPEITVHSVETDVRYQELMGKDEQFEEEEGMEYRGDGLEGSARGGRCGVEEQV